MTNSNASRRSSMKFYCDKCRTKYSIADEKVRGKVLKVRCKKCSYIITVREASAPVSARRQAAPSVRPRRGQVQWYYAINGQSFCPMRQGTLANKFARGELGDAVYVWNESFAEWKLVGEVEEFSAALARGAKAVPRQRTLGISQPLEAVSRETLEREGAAAAARAVPGAKAAPVREPEPKPKPKSVSPKMKEPLRSAAPAKKEEIDSKQARQDRLEALRARLNLEPEPEVAAEPEPELEALADGDGESPAVEDELFDDPTELMESPFTGDGFLAESKQESGLLESLEFEFATAETLPAGDLSAGDLLADEPVEEEEAPETEPTEASVYDGLFSGLDEEDAGEEELLEELVAQLDEPEEFEDLEGAEAEGASEDAVPFFPEAPVLTGEMPASMMSRSDEVTGSLLIQLNALKSDGRKRAIAGAIVAVLCLGVVGTIGYLGLTREKVEVVEEQGPRIRMDNVGKAPQFREYTEEERRRGLGEIFLDQELVISREESRAAFEQEERRSKGGKAASAESAKLPSVPKIDPAAFRTKEGELDGMKAGASDEAGVQNRFQRGGMAGLAGSGSDGSPALRGLAGGGGDDDFDDERFRAMAAVQTDTQRGVYNPRDEFDELSAPREALSGQDIARGMQNVMNSVGACRERHIMRGGTLTQDSVEVTLDVMPNGRVEALKLAPSSLDDTDFGRCMHSHIRRWRFPPFKGETTRVRTPFYLQD